jgi:hypothetical protein
VCMYWCINQLKYLSNFSSSFPYLFTDLCIYDFCLTLFCLFFSTF